MKLQLLALAMITTLPIWSEPLPLKEIADLSDLPLLNPDLAKRKTAKISLSNGLEAYLISDPSADQSAVSVAVGAGSWNDPDEYPGMAHFCEHMLFLGSHKFPKENEFFSLVTDNSGIANAFTSTDRTVYMFSSSHDGFQPILERFARFFIDPLFNPNGIAREMHAVDQEFSKNIENDAWREYMIFKETGNPDHPNIKFSTGNSQTLANIPQSALKKWHHQHYAAERMRLVIYSSLPIDTLKETTRALFSPVPTHETSRFDDTKELTSPQQRGHIVYIKPIKQRQTLTMTWELPTGLSLDPSKPAQLAAYALARGQSHSLNEKLKNEGLIDDLSVSVDEMGGEAHRCFQIKMELTNKGLQQMDQAILRCFQALSGLRASGVPAYFFQELNAISKLNYQFQPQQDAFQFVASIGESLLDENLSTFPRAQLLSSSYEPQKILSAIRHLTPESCLIFLQADPALTKVAPDRRERWMGAEYAIRDVPADWMKSWRAATAHSDIRLADPNPFIPNRFDLASAPNDPKTQTPLLLAEDESGIAYYARIVEFQSPESVYHLHLLSPKLTSCPHGLCFASLYLDYLTDRLGPTLSAAGAAGLRASFSNDHNRIHIKISGFSDKAPLLLQEILKQLAVPSPTREQFEIFKARHEKGYANSVKDLAAVQAKELLSSLINQENSTKRERLAALKEISYEDFCDYLSTLFNETYTEALFSGNLTLKQAESAWLDVRHLLQSAPFSKEKHPATKILSLPENQGPFVIQEQTEVLGHAALLLLDVGTFSFERRAAQEILSSHLKESFFNTLRTKQNTGYIAQSDGMEVEMRLFQYFLVQSNSHQPEDLLYRFELFLESTLQDLSASLSESRFNTIRQNLTQLLQNRFRNLKEKSALWNQLAFETEADFAWIEKRLEGYKNLSYETFLQESRVFLSRENRKRLAILFEGRVKEPFAYESITPSEIGEISEYLTRSDIFSEKEVN